MSKRIVIIGGVAAGMSAASQAKRRLPSAEVIVLERGEYVSYGACGMPYNIEDRERSIEDLVVISAERFRSQRQIDVRLKHEAIRIDPENQLVEYRAEENAETGELRYDELIIATGASAFKPPLPGLEAPGVFVLRELTDGARIKQFIADNQPKRAVILGAGYIGMEMAEALRARGLEVTILEMKGQVVPGFEPAIAKAVQEELTRQGVVVHLDVAAQGIQAEGTGLTVRTSKGNFHAELVLVSVGVRPNTALAKAAGVQLGKSGAIAVDAQQRTNIPHIFAAGDCSEANHLVTQEPTWVPLGTTANKQGKIAGANATGAHEEFAGITASAAFKVFDLEVGRTGLGLAEIEALGLSAISATSTHRTRGHGYPGSKPITTTIYAEKGTRRLLGAQIVGGEGVAGRVNVFATALSARFTTEQLESLDLAYAPPLAPVYDPILIAANVANKQLE